MNSTKHANVKCNAALAIAVILAGANVPAVAQEAPAKVKDMVACRSIEDDQARLACYDQKVAVFDDAQSSGELLVAEKEVVDKARRDVFGLKAADNPLFTDQNGAQLNEIRSTIKSLRSGRGGKRVFVLEDGSAWQHTEGRIGRSPKAGQNIVISRGALGSFKAVVENRPSIKVIRIR